MINIQNSDDNKCRYLHAPDHNPGKIIKADKYFVKILDSKDIKI